MYIHTTKKHVVTLTAGMAKKMISRETFLSSRIPAPDLGFAGHANTSVPVVVTHLKHQDVNIGINLPKL